jgi:hypothetical protein
LEINSANFGGVREEDEEKDHHQSDLLTCGLLRIEDKLWLLVAEVAATSAFDFLSVGESSDTASPSNYDDDDVYLPDCREGCDSIFKKCDPFIEF